MEVEIARAKDGGLVLDASGVLYQHAGKGVATAAAGLNVIGKGIDVSRRMDRRGDKGGRTIAGRICCAPLLGHVVQREKKCIRQVSSLETSFSYLGCLLFPWRW